MSNSHRTTINFGWRLIYIFIWISAASFFGFADGSWLHLMSQTTDDYSSYIWIISTSIVGILALIYSVLEKIWRRYDMKNRGALTEAAQEYAKSQLGREITGEELRLYPYIDYCIKNDGNIDRSSLSVKEEDLLRRILVHNGVEWTGNKINVTYWFYKYLQEILAMTYIEFIQED